MVLPISLLERIVSGTCVPPSSLRFRQLFTSSCSRQSSSSSDSSKSSRDSAHSYSATLKLPRTPFPLRADAAKREKLFRQRTTEELYLWQAEQKERPLFVLHDGPPYANGNLHIGHALNKILKDIINRSKLMQGHRVHYVPGYDTHGLPLELKALSALKAPAASLTPQVIRAAARKEAEKGVAVQSSEFREFGGLGAFGEEEGYRTMDWSYEKRQLGVVREMVRKGLITTHHRPTLYSPSSRTALAEAELEYKDDHISRSVYVSFPISELGALESTVDKLGLAKSPVALSVWTTTAWTLPANVAVAISETMEYSLVRNESNGSLLIVCEERITALQEILGTTLAPLASFPGTDLLSTTYTSPLSSSSPTSSPRPIFAAPYVTSTTGTGLVHTSPAHGVEDWEAWKAFQSRLYPSKPLGDVLCAVDGAGRFSEVLGQMVEDGVKERLIGKEVLGDGAGAVIDLLREQGKLLKEVAVAHKYPYDWRTKKPVIFRASSQWFANLENVKDQAVKALDDVVFYPRQGRKLLEIFVRGRSEWCISRQRAWGVPLPIVYSYPSGASDPLSSSTPYLTPSNIDHITSVLDSHGIGTDYWWEGSAEEFVEPAELERSRAEGRSWRKGTDTLDVWFDSGCSWTLLRELGLRPSGPGELPYADVYLEGSDQHRGWFQSSLLTAISSSGEKEPKAPYGAVITHGMVLDDKGRKMSKSLGNVVSPLAVIHGGMNLKKEPAYGTDLLRVWVASVDSSGDVPIGAGILSQIFEGLRKIRNTARFMLGNLGGEQREAFVTKELGLIERYVLNEVYQLDVKTKEGYNFFAFSKVYQALASFSNTTLSSFYFDVIKDSLYADSKTFLQRRQIVYTLQKVFDTYLSVLAPMAPHLAEEIHHFATGATADPKAGERGASSVFKLGWAKVDESWNDPTVKQEMDSLLVVREEIMGLLEQARTAKLIGSSTEAEVVISTPSPLILKHLDVLKTLFIVSDVTISENVDPSSRAWHYSKTLAGEMSVTVLPCSKHKCPRCWTYTRTETEDVCGRCEGVLGA